MSSRSRLPKLRDARADRVGLGRRLRPVREGRAQSRIRRSTGVRPGVCRTGEKTARARASTVRARLPCRRPGAGRHGQGAHGRRPRRAAVARARRRRRWRARPSLRQAASAHGDVAGLGVRGWQPALAGRATPVGEGWRWRSGVRGGSIVAKAAAWRLCHVGAVRLPRRCDRASSGWSPGSSWCLSGVDTMSVRTLSLLF